ncbi:MAG: DNA cytosine methyltransferase [Methylococcales bacterium]
MTISGKTIPVVDLFAGPGGLGEGFSSVMDSNGNRRFEIRLSIEKDLFAHQTLLLRAIFRMFPRFRAPECYYDYLRGEIDRQKLFKSPEMNEALQLARQETRCVTLGEHPVEVVDQWIEKVIGNHNEWVLIGGPPCQAYSTAGRSRMRKRDPTTFEKDERHFLYKEYLRIIRKFRPGVFVMENVKGLLSSTHGGSLIFTKIREDLSRPESDLEYEIRSFVRTIGTPKPGDFIIGSENHGIPQRRHRVILFGVRSDLADRPNRTLVWQTDRVSVRDMIYGMPPIRSRISRGKDSFDNWINALRDTPIFLRNWTDPKRNEIEELMARAINQARFITDIGGRFMKVSNFTGGNVPMELINWILDPRIKGFCQHEARSHMREDLHRYLFAACHAQVFKVSPKLNEFPLELSPAHKNLNAVEVPFDDRFRVQCWDLPATTVMSHMAKDGHYFIHPDPRQCRSMTLREAARLQTFPDNYFFEGSKTQQYTQVGNAVPPYLAKQIAQIVADFIEVNSEQNPPAHFCALSNKNWNKTVL